MRAGWGAVCLVTCKHCHRQVEFRRAWNDHGDGTASFDWLGMTLHVRYCEG